jgi:hypothetical protein
MPRGVVCLVHANAQVDKARRRPYRLRRARKPFIMRFGSSVSQALEKASIPARTASLRGNSSQHRIKAFCRRTARGPGIASDSEHG